MRVVTNQFGFMDSYILDSIIFVKPTACVMDVVCKIINS